MPIVHMAPTIKRYAYSALIVVTLGAIAGGYQNCAAKVEFQHQASALGLPSITINNGAQYTNDLGVTLTLNSAGTHYMFITNDSRCSDPVWVNQKSSSPWTLEQENADNKVFAKFKTDTGEETDCVQASIVHDNQNPIVFIDEGPAPETARSDASFRFSGQDPGSGVDYFECTTGSDPFQKCDAQYFIPHLTDRSHNLIVRVVDRAGNRSNPIDHQWLVDTRPPTVRITQTPSNPSISSTAIFEFEGEDFGGSGIRSYICQLGTTKLEPCSSPAVFTGLTGGTHNFSVVSVDRVGLVSTPATFSFLVDNIPSGEFTITGVNSQPLDNRIDGWLRGTTPTVHWTTSSEAVRYRVSIRQNNQVVCAEQETTQTSFAFGAGCSLQDLTTYYARVVAFDQVGLTRPATDFVFIVDRTGPAINITGPTSSNDQKEARFEFSVVDAAPGVLNTVTCYKTSMVNNQPQVSQQSCSGLSQLLYTNLSFGEHRFKIVATDMAENSSEREITWTVRQIICDPFSQDLTNCSGGLVGDIFYLNDAQRATFVASANKTVDYFYTSGTKLNALLRLNQLFVSTRRFNTGFPTSDNNLIKDDNGNTLVEYFAFRLQSILKLDADNPEVNLRDAPGWYQFAIISDDGSKLKIKRTPSSAYETILSNDGDHATLMKCSTSAVELNAASRIPIQVEYYQGPRDYIALTLVARRVDSENAAPDSFCNQGGRDLFFGPYPHQDYSNVYAFGQMLERGWKVVGSRNLIAPQ